MILWYRLEPDSGIDGSRLHINYQAFSWSVSAKGISSFVAKYQNTKPPSLTPFRDPQPQDCCQKLFNVKNINSIGLKEQARNARFHKVRFGAGNLLYINGGDCKALFSRSVFGDQPQSKSSRNRLQGGSP